MRTRLERLAIPAAFLAFALAARLLLAHAPARLAVDLAQPLAVATNWGAYGAALLVVLIAGLATAGLAYARTAESPAQPARTAILCALALAAAFAAPVLFSSDVYAYAAYGELARIGANAYAPAPHLPGNALLAAAAWQWSDALPVCVYGPAFVLAARTIVELFAPLGALAQLDALRALAAGSLLLCIPLAYAAFPGDARARMRAAATIGLNPAAIWCAAEGHNDALALAVVLAGFALVRRGLVSTGSAIAALSALVKLPGAAAALAFAAVHPRARPGALAGAALAGAFSLPLAAGLFHGAAAHGTYAPQASLQALVHAVALFALHSAGPATAVAVSAAVLAAAVVGAGGIARIRRGENDGWVRLGLAAWLLVPNPQPWYGVWLVALAALAPATRAATVALLLSFTSLLRYAPDAGATPVWPLAIAALGIAATFPFAGLCYNERP